MKANRLLVVSAAILKFSLLSVGSIEAQGGLPSGFSTGSTHVGPRIWIGNLNGATAFGGQIERAFTKPGDYGPGVIGFGGGVDYYTWSYRYQLSGEQVGWDYTAIPIEVFSNYHFVIDGNKKLDPYLGIALVYETLSVKEHSSQQYGFGPEGTPTASAAVFVAQAGARYFLTNNMAINGQVGLGYGSLGVGLSWKF